MTAKLEITRTTPLFPNGVFVQWALEATGGDSPFLIALYRSGSVTGPWDKLLDPTPGVYNFADRFPTPAVAGMTAPNELSLVRGIFYKVEAHAADGSTISTVAQVEPKLDGRQRLIKRKMLRDETVMLQRLNGVPVAILKRRHWGTRCPKCYDKYTKEPVRGNCANCFGTTFTGGYFDPVLTWAKRGTTPTESVLTEQGKSDLASTNMTMLDVPGMEQDDVLVFLQDNRRFVVKKVLPTELRTVTVHQRLLIVELPRSDISHRVKVDPDRTPKLF